MAKTNLVKGRGLKELRSRLFFVLIGIAVFRLGTYIPIPYVNLERVSYLMSSPATENGLLKIFNLFSGGALTKLSIFALGVMPYISASIIFQMTTTLSPKLNELRKEGDSGQKKITQYTRYATLGLALVQSFGVATYIINQPNLTNASTAQFYFISILSMTSGSMLLMWLGEQMTEHGISNGLSLLIFSGIVANLPFEVGTTMSQASRGEISYFSIWLLLATLLSVIGFVVFIERAQRRITVNYAKRQQGRKIYASHASHLPLKLNMAGVIPPIFASSILMVPVMLSNWFSASPALGWLVNVGEALRPGSLLYTIIFSVTVVFFCFFYTSLVFNPKETADNLKKSGAFILGVRPGEQTAKYVESIMKKLTLVGAIYITAICLLPVFIVSLFGHSLSFTLGGTSLLIVVVVIMDFMAQVQSHMMSTQYESLLRKANLSNYGKS
jgi:preprotein translocase subunit SecY